MCFSPPFDCIYSRRVEFNVNSNDVSVVFISSKSRYDKKNDTENVTVYDAEKTLFGLKQLSRMVA